MKRVKGRINKISQVIDAWETLAANESFAGLTLEQLKALLQPLLEAQEKVSADRAALREAKNVCVAQSKSCYDTALLVVNGVKGHPALGEESSLYETMGYIRKSDRKSGLTRKGRAKVL